MNTTAYRYLTPTLTKCRICKRDVIALMKVVIE